MNLNKVNCIFINRARGSISLLKLEKDEFGDYDEITLATFEVIENEDEDLSWSEFSAESFHVKFMEVKK